MAEQTPPGGEDIQVDAPDGTRLSFPSSMSMDAIKDVMRRKYGQQKPPASSFQTAPQPMTTPLPGAAAGPSIGSGMQQAASQEPSPAQQPLPVQVSQQVAGLPESVQPIRLDEAGDQVVDVPAEFLTKSRQQEAWRTALNAPDKASRDAAHARIKADREVRAKMDRVFAQKQEDRRLVDEQASRDLQFSLPPQEVPSGLPEGQGPATTTLDPREQKVRADYIKSLTPEQQAYRASKKESGAWADRDAFDEDVSSLTHAMNVLDARERRLLRKSEFRKAQQQTDAAGDVMFQDNSDVMAEAQDIDLGRKYVIERLQSAVRRHPEYASEELARKAKTLQADAGAMINPQAYNVVQPIRFAIDKFAASLLTTPRSFGSAEYGRTDQLAEWAERSMENIRADEPTKFRGNILDDNGVNPERILPKVVETIGQAALLIGTSPTRPALLASAFVQSNGDYYKQATESRLSHDEAKKFAWSAAALNSALELASPNDAARQLVGGALRKEIATGLEQGLTTKEILGRAAKVAAKEALPEMAQEGGQYVGDKGAAYLANRILGGDRLDDHVKFSEFTENALLGGVVGGLAGGVPEAMRLASISETAKNPQKVAEAATAMGNEQAKEKVQRIVSAYEGNGLANAPPEKAAVAADAIIRKNDIEQAIKKAPMDPALEAAIGDPRKIQAAELTTAMIEAMGIPADKAKAALIGAGMEKAPEGTKAVTNPDGSVTLEKKPEAGEKKKPKAAATESREQAGAVTPEAAIPPIKDKAVERVLGGRKMMDVSDSQRASQSGEFVDKTGRVVYLRRSVSGPPEVEALVRDGNNFKSIGRLDLSPEDLSAGYVVPGYGSSAQSIRVSKDDRRKGIGNALIRFAEQSFGKPVDYSRIPKSEPISGEMRGLISSQAKRRGSGPYYHGSPVRGLLEMKEGGGGLGSGVYLTKSMDDAIQYAAGWAGGVHMEDIESLESDNISKVFLRPGIKIHKTEDSYISKEDVDKLRNDHDGVETPSETIIFNPDDVWMSSRDKDHEEQFKSRKSKFLPAAAPTPDTGAAPGVPAPEQQTAEPVANTPERHATRNKQYVVERGEDGQVTVKPSPTYKARPLPPMPDVDAPKALVRLWKDQKKKVDDAERQARRTALIEYEKEYGVDTGRGHKTPIQKWNESVADVTTRMNRISDQNKDARLYALQFLLNGGKINFAAAKKELGSNARTDLDKLKKNGILVDDPNEKSLQGVADELAQSMAEQLGTDVGDAADLRTALIDALGHGSRSGVLKAMTDILDKMPKTKDVASSDPMTAMTPEDWDDVNAVEEARSAFIEYVQKTGGDVDLANAWFDDQVGANQRASFDYETPERQQQLIEIAEQALSQLPPDGTETEAGATDAAPREVDAGANAGGVGKAQDAEEQRLAAEAKRARAERDKFVADWNERGQGLFAPEEGMAQQTIDGGFDNSQENFDAKVEPLNEKVRQADKALADYVNSAASRAQAAAQQTSIPEAKTPTDDRVYYPTEDAARAAAKLRVGQKVPLTQIGREKQRLIVEFGKPDEVVIKKIRPVEYENGWILSYDIDGGRGARPDIARAEEVEPQQASIQTGGAEAAARKAAAILEKAKLKPDQLYALPLPPSVWNGAIRAMQEVIIAGGKAVDAIAAAIKHIQDSDWWKNKATQKEKDGVMSHMQGRISDLEAAIAAEDVASLKQNIQQARATGVQKTRTKQQEARKEFVQKVKDALRPLASRLSAAQAKLITARAAKVNPTSEASVKKFEKYAEKVIAKADYAEKVAAAEKMAKAIDKAAKKNASEKRDAGLNSIAREFAALDIDQANIDQYTDIAERLLSNLTTPKVNRGVQGPGSVQPLDFAISNKEVSDYIEKQQKVEDAQAEQDIVEEFEQVRQQLGLEAASLSPKDMADILAAMNGDEAAAKRLDAEKADEGRKAIMKETAAAKLSELNAHIASLPEPVSKEKRAILDDLNKIDISLLTPTDVAWLITGVNSIVTNDGWGGMRDFAAKGKAHEFWRQNAGKDFGRPGDNFFSKTDQLAMIANKIARGVREAAKFRLGIGLEGTQNAITDAQRQTQEKQARRNRVAEKAGYKDTRLNRYKMGVYGYMTSHFAGTPEEIQAEFDKKAANLRESVARIRDKNKAFDSVREKAKEYEQAVNEVLGDAKSMEALKLPPALMSMVENERAEFAKNQQATIESARLDYNKVNEQQNDYLPASQISVNASTTSADAKKEFERSNFNRRLNTEEASSKQKKTNSLRPNSIIDLDFFKVADESYEEAAADNAGARHVAVMREVMSDPRAMETMGADTHAMLKNAMIDIVNSEENKKNVFSAGKLFDKVVRTAIRKGQRIALAGLAQYPKQATVGFSTMMALGKDAPLYFRSFRDVTAAHDAEDSWQRRLMQGEQVWERAATLGGLEKVGDPISAEAILTGNESAFAEAAKRFYHRSGKVASFTMKPLAWSDALQAQAAWMAFYQSELKKKGVDLSDHAWHEQKDEEAAAFANQAVEHLQNANTAMSMPAIYRDKGGLRQIMHLAWAYSSFALNMKKRMARDIQTLRNGSKEDKKFARVSIAGSILETFMYSTMAFAITKVSTEVIRSMINSLWPPDDDEEEKARKAEQEAKKRHPATQVALRTAFDVALGGQPSMLETFEKDKIINPLYAAITTGDQRPLYYVNDDAGLGVLGSLAENFVNLAEAGKVAVTGEAKKATKGGMIFDEPWQVDDRAKEGVLKKNDPVFEMAPVSPATRQMAATVALLSLLELGIFSDQDITRRPGRELRRRMDDELNKMAKEIDATVVGRAKGEGAPQQPQRPQQRPQPPRQ